MELYIVSRANENKEMHSEFSSVFLKSLEKLPYASQRLMKCSLLKARRGVDEEQLLEADQAHYFQGEYFSASYSGDWLALVIAEKKVGIDIEVIKPRNRVFLDKYSGELALFGSERWEYFYLLWTAKEALLKKSDGKSLDLIDQMKLVSVKDDAQAVICGRNFEWKLEIEFLGERYQIFSTFDHGKTISLAC